MDEHGGFGWWENTETLEIILHLIHANSVLVKSMKFPSNSPTNVAVNLQPSLFPKDEFESVLRLQTEFNELLDCVSRDHDFLVETFEKYVRYSIHLLIEY